MEIKNYKFGFDVSALIMFVAVMLPNIKWFCVPAPNDILRGESVTQVLDVFVSVFQVVMLAALIVLKNKNADKLKISPTIILCAVFCCLYWICWVLYYCAIAHTSVIIFLCLFPCAAFIFFCFYRKNFIALIPAVVFTVLHFTSTAINFL